LGLAVLLSLPFLIRRPLVAGALGSKYTVFSTVQWYQQTNNCVEALCAPVPVPEDEVQNGDVAEFALEHHHEQLDPGFECELLEGDNAGRLFFCV